ncbi:MAG: methyltransferase domain-containing protein [Alphaproteobacteria bacterium]|nr:methyltransferase domain-containing protein [Alphaproteobacteria bacterium]
MGLSLSKKSSGGGGASFKDRFAAWWHGTELREPEPDFDDGEYEEVEVGEDSGGENVAVGEAPAASPDEWSEAKCKIANGLWTPGFISPGGAQYVEELVAGCSLTSDETMLEVGIGMGGNTTTIISKFGNYVTGYENDEKLAAEAKKTAVEYDIDGKVKIVGEPFDLAQVKTNYFRAALMREALYTMEDKETVIAKMCDSLKEGESFLVMTDFLFDESADSEELNAWRETQPKPVYPWTADALKAALESHGVLARIMEDESSRYSEMIRGAWAAYLNEIKDQSVSEAFGHQLVHEAQYWLLLTSALDSGVLKIYRIEGVKNS